MPRASGSMHVLLHPMLPPGTVNSTKLEYGPGAMYADGWSYSSFLASL